MPETMARLAGSLCICGFLGTESRKDAPQVGKVVSLLGEMQVKIEQEGKATLPAALC